MKLFKKICSLGLSSFAVLILSGFLSLQPIAEPKVFAHHNSANACNDVTLVGDGRTETDSVASPAAAGRSSGIADSGTFNFDQPATHDYQTCGEKKSNTYKLDLQAGAVNVTGQFLRGWVWNDNLGYVSFYCKDDDNLDLKCGPAIDYGVVINPGTNTDGRVRGFAWGDNTGWISMGCDKGKNLSGGDCGDLADPDTQNIQYGVYVTKPDGGTVAGGYGCTRTGGTPLQPGDLYGYGWSDSVGWMNFCGAHVDGMAGALLPRVRFEPADGANVYANGADSHKIIVELVENGVVLADPGTHAVSVTSLVWADTLRADQVTACTPLDAVTGTTAACVYNGANKPTGASFAWQAAKSGLVGDLKAIAPTNEKDKIRLNTLQVNLDGSVYELTANRDFTFSQAVSVTRISSTPLDTETREQEQISAIRNSSEPLFLTAEKHGGAGLPADTSINIITQLHDCNSPYEFVFDEGTVGDVKNTTTGALLEAHNLGTEADKVNIDRAGTVCPTVPNGTTLVDTTSATLKQFLDSPQSTLVKLIFSDIESADAEFDVAPGATTDKAVGIRTRVGYTAPAPFNTTVRYFSRMLVDGSVINQAAQVLGNVRIDIQKDLKAGAVAQSLGNDSKNTQSKREKFYRVIKNTIGTPRLRAIAGVTGGTLTINKNTDLKDGLLYFNRTNVSSPSDQPCKIIFDDASGAMNFSKDVTVVTEGCDVYIDQDIMSAAGRTGRLGIIALEDLGMTKSARKGGNIYICHRVKDIEANFVTDGSIFGYGLSETECGGTAKEALLDANGLPSPAGSRATAFRQLTLVGSLLSDNTYGGSLLNPPQLGDGTKVTDPADAYKTRLYDINFLRYATTRPGDIDTDGVNTCWANTADQLSALLGDKTCYYNSPERNKGIVNITYRAPTGNMAIFKGVK
ncbi:MAG: hypothetical protein AAB588_05870 [Patescibacteria group bacterium]